MRLRILAPQISSQFARNIGVSPRSRHQILGKLQEGKLLVAHTDLKKMGTAMTIYNGRIVPADAAEREIPKWERPMVVFKLAGQPNQATNLEHELKILDALGDMPGIPSVIYQDSLLVDEAGKDSPEDFRQCPFFVMPELPGRALSSFSIPYYGWQDRLPSRDKVGLLVGRIFPALAERLAQLHERDIVHCDLKPANAFYDPTKNFLSLLDFERSNQIGAEPRVDKGTVGFSPLEMAERSLEKEDVRQDVYAFGITCFSLLTGEQLLFYEGMQTYEEYLGGNWRRVTREEYFEYFKKTYYPQLREFLNQPTADLVIKSNLPPELKETALGKYLVELFHPSFELRPNNMGQVAQQMRSLGGQLLEHEIWSSST